MSPEQARKYIAEFRLEGRGQVTFIETNKRRIEFDNMTDEDAIDVALILADLQSEIDKRKGKAQ